MPRPGLKLTDAECEAITSERDMAKKRKDWKVRNRLRCLLLCHEGKTISQAAQICEVARSTAAEWLKKYRNAGLKSLVERGAYKGKASQLSDDQKQELRLIIRGGPESANLDTGVWTAAVVAEVIKKRFGVTLSLSQIRRTLRKLGFSVQYPRQKLSKADKEMQKTWVEMSLPQIKKKSMTRMGY